MKLQIIILTVILSGCNLQPLNYDNNEYLLLSTISNDISRLKSECGDLSKSTMASDLKDTINLFEIYTSNFTNQYTSNKLANILQSDITELLSRPNNKVYCNRKLQLMQLKTTEYLPALGKLRR